MNFFNEKWKDILVNTIAGIVVLIIPRITDRLFSDADNILTVQIAAIAIIVITNIISNLMLKKGKKSNDEQVQILEQMGIVKIVPTTTEGEGSTESILSECDNNFSFMGIAANKWIHGAMNFDMTMKKILARNGSVRFILLNPISITAKNMSIASQQVDSYMREKILNNIRELKKYYDLGLKIQVKVFSYMPVFRIAIVDDEKIFLGHYKVNNDGSHLPQLILQGKNKILFRQFWDYFNVTWNRSDLKSIDFSKLDDPEYLNYI